MQETPVSSEMLTAESIGGRRSWLLTVLLDYAALVLVLVVMIVVFQILEPTFISIPRFIAIVDPNLPALVMAVGMTYVLITGQIDLSVGSVMALTGGVIGVTYRYAPLPVAIAAGLGTGLVCGLFNGLVTIRWNLPSFIVTLGMLQIARGATYLLTLGDPPQLTGSRIVLLSASIVPGVSYALIVAIVAVVLGQVVLSYTVYGRYMVAVGTNEEAVRLSGVDARPVKVSVFVLTSLLATLAAVLEISRNLVANPNAGKEMELRVIAAVVVGGTSLMGGRGTVIGALLGWLIIEVLSAGLVALSFRDQLKPILIGSIVIAAGILDYYRRRLARARTGQ